MTQNEKKRGKLFEPGWSYTKVSDQGPGYLKKRFARIRKEIRDARRRVVVLPRTGKQGEK
jgi:hypothetical protein